MIIHNTEHTFYYIDPTKKKTAGTVGGDGSSAAAAARDCPNDFENRNNVIYLVRRSDEGYFAQLPLRTTSPDVTSLVILGMPKQGEKFWNEMPADAKEAWKDSDVATNYATICKYATTYDEFDSTGWNLPNCRNFTMYNIAFGCYATENWEEKGWNISCSSEYGCNGDIQNCKFGNLNILRVGSELGNTSEFYVFESAGTEFNPAKCHGGRFISLGNNWSSICTIKNVVIDSYSSKNSIYCGKQRNIIIENVDFRSRTEYGDECGIAWGSDNDGYQAPTVHVKNCTYTLYYSPIDNEIPSFIGGQVNRIYIDGIVAGIGTTQSFSPYRNMISINPLINITSRFTGSSIKNVTIDFPDFHGASGNLVVFTYEHNKDSLVTAEMEQYIEIKNIEINMCQSAIAPFSNDGHNDSNGNLFNSGSPGILSLRCNGGRDRQVSSDFLVQDLTLNGLRSNMLYARNAILDLQDSDIVGNVILSNCVGKIRSIACWYPGYALKDEGANLLYVGSIRCNLVNNYEESNGTKPFRYNKQEAVVTSGYSHILVHEVVGNCWTSEYWNSSYPHSYICTNDGGQGNYTCRTGRTKCQTWSAYNDQTDTGCSLRLINESADDWNNRMVIGGDPFKGITRSVQPGSYNAIFYLALYGYNDRFDEIKDRLFIRIKLPNGTYTYSNAGKCVLDTTTTRTNIEGTTNYKIGIPLDIDQAGDIEIDFAWSFYMNGGVTLLDPYPKLTARI